MSPIVIIRLTELEELGVGGTALAPAVLSVVLPGWVSGKGLDDLILTLQEAISQAIELIKKNTAHQQRLGLYIPVAWNGG